MDEQNQSKFEDWAIVEVMGHQTYAGFVTTQAFGQAVLFRVDVPELPERDRTLNRAEYINGVYYESGSVVRESPVPGYSKLIGAGSIYAITPCTEDAAKLAVDRVQPRKLTLLSVPVKAEIAAPPDEIDEQDETEKTVDAILDEFGI